MAMFPAMHRVVVPVAPHTPLFELAVPCGPPLRQATQAQHAVGRLAIRIDH
jgi:hypothetical protein